MRLELTHGVDHFSRDSQFESVLLTGRQHVIVSCHQFSEIDKCLPYAQLGASRCLIINLTERADQTSRRTASTKSIIRARSGNLKCPQR